MVFNLFKSKPIALSKRKDFAKTEYVFTDSNGKRYFKYSNEFDMPIKRQGKLQIFLSEWKIGLDEKDYDLCLQSMDEALRGVGKTLTDELRIAGQPDLTAIGFLITEMRNRKNLVVNNDIFMKMVACLYIREDQSPDIWDAELEMEKVKQFEKEAAGRLWDFFYSAGLTKYFSFLNDIKGSYAELAEQARIKAEALQKLLSASLQAKLANLSATEKES